MVIEEDGVAAVRRDAQGEKTLMFRTEFYTMPKVTT